MFTSAVQWLDDIIAVVIASIFIRYCRVGIRSVMHLAANYSTVGVRKKEGAECRQACQSLWQQLQKRHNAQH